MLGSKRTIPFWRPKRALLNLERALAPNHQGSGKGGLTAQTLAGARARDRLSAEAKKKGRFSER